MIQVVYSIETRKNRMYPIMNSPHGTPEQGIITNYGECSLPGKGRLTHGSNCKLRSVWVSRL